MINIMPPLSKANKYFRQQLKGLKGVLFALTFAFFLEAWVLIIVGAVFIDSVSAQLSLTSSLSSLVSGVIFVGFLLLVLSALGMWGIIKERKTWMRGVAMALGLLIILEFGFGIYGLKNKDQAHDLMQEGWMDAYADNSMQSLLTIEQQFQCCGFENVTDSATANCSTTYNYTQGCWPAMKSGFLSASIGIGIAALLIAFTQLAAVIISIILFQRLPTEGEKEAYLLEEHRKLNKMVRQGGARL